MDDLSQMLADVRRGMIPAYVYNDDDVFQLEKEHIFERSWIFVAHESEIPEPGDYVVRRVLEDSFIVARDEAGQVRVMFNMCLHRGMQICRAELGNASHFRCSYHGWSYRNDGRLVGLPFHAEAYGGEDGFTKAGQALLSAPSVDTFNGLIFVNLDPNAESLQDYIGDFAYYLDFYVKQSKEGIEVRGPQRWRVKANWKIGTENASGDSYHTPQTHRSVVEIGLFREPTGAKRKEGALYWCDKGGGTTYKLPAGTFRERMGYVGYPDEMINHIENSWSDGQKRLISDDGFMISAATLFPSFSLVHNWPKVDANSNDDQVVPFITMRVWQPISATETEVLSWFIVDKNATPEFKEASYKGYLMCFGSTGMFEQDDVENWVSITSIAGGSMAKRLLLNNRMGLTSTDKPVNAPMADFHGPGVAYVGYGEFNQRALLKEWADCIEKPLDKIDQLAMGEKPGATILKGGIS
ncbi:MAG: Rieske 2Fe-2S domain-containing protein [Acidimicrobiaceae bacterium]|nr:Rieske 2Fe-2S domain-containing protein [Acidimicrobiaceae bacterium]